MLQHALKRSDFELNYLEKKKRGHIQNKSLIKMKFYLKKVLELMESLNWTIMAQCFYSSKGLYSCQLYNADLAVDREIKFHPLVFLQSHTAYCFVSACNTACAFLLCSILKWLKLSQIFLEGICDFV